MKKKPVRDNKGVNLNKQVCWVKWLSEMKAISSANKDWEMHVHIHMKKCSFNTKDIYAYSQSSLKFCSLCYKSTLQYIYSYAFAFCLCMRSKRKFLMRMIHSRAYCIFYPWYGTILTKFEVKAHLSLGELVGLGLDWDWPSQRVIWLFFKSWLIWVFVEVT